MRVISHKRGSTRNREDVNFPVSGRIQSRCVRMEDGDRIELRYVIHSDYDGDPEGRYYELQLRPSEVLDIIGSFDAKGLEELVFQKQQQRRKERS